MAIQQLFSGTSGQTDYIITAFEFLNPGDIDITVGTDVKTSPSDYSIEGSVIKFTSVPTVGTDNIKAERSTDISTKTHTYTPGSSITAKTLNDNQDQALFKIEEVKIDAVNAADLTGDHGAINVSSNGGTWTIKQDTIDGDHLKDNILEAKHIKPDAVGSSELANNAVDTNAIQDDAVTAAKLANSINTEIAANTAKVTNATHTGEVTGATALTLVDNIVDEANLKVSNTPTNGHVLTAQSGNTGGLTWATPIPAGSIIETFTLPCSNKSITVQSGTYTTANVDAKQQPADENYFDINGSSMPYTPPSGTKTVIYKFTYFSSWVNDWTIFHQKLFIDSTEVVIARQQFGHGYRNENYVTIEWPFLIQSDLGSDDIANGLLKTWTSNKTIKVQGRRYNNNHQVKLHETYYWDGATVNNLVLPKLSITAIS